MIVHVPYQRLMAFVNMPSLMKKQLVCVMVLEDVCAQLMNFFVIAPRELDVTTIKI